MNFFSYRDEELYAEAVPLRKIASSVGTPCYVYSKAALTHAYQAFDNAFAAQPHLICYAAKANSTLAILNLFARLGSGFDIVSGGELQRVIAAGGDPRKVVFSGVGKTRGEIQQALQANILCFNVESAGELQRINEIAGQLGVKAPISFRVNPDVDPKTHPYIATGLKTNKFGVAFNEALPLYRLAHSLPNIQVEGIDCHIGSQLTEIPPFVEAAEKVMGLVDQLQNEGISIAHLDLGGGLGIRYKDETPPAIQDYAAALIKQLKGRSQKLLFEPGRALVGNAGVLVTTVEYIKSGEEKNFAIVDAAMNDLMRPALYQAYHEIAPVKRSHSTPKYYDVVGPVCESGDFLGEKRLLDIGENDLLCIFSAGAYGMSMSSNYNTRPRAPEIIVDGADFHLVRERETISQLMAGEKLLTLR